MDGPHEQRSSIFPEYPRCSIRRSTLNRILIEKAIHVRVTWNGTCIFHGLWQPSGQCSLCIISRLSTYFWHALDTSAEPSSLSSQRQAVRESCLSGTRGNIIREPGGFPSFRVLISTETTMSSSLIPLVLRCRCCFFERLGAPEPWKM